MILTIKPSRLALYHNTKKKTAAQVRKATGADIVINCWLYDMSTFKACCDVKVDGKVLSDDQYKYWGYGFNNEDKRMTMSNEMSKWDNYFSCIAMIKDGKKTDMIYGTALGGCRPRTAVGFKADDTMVVYCSKEGKTIPNLQTHMLQQGCIDAINLDGGGSVQIASDYGNITSDRKVHGYICIWEEKKKVNCPYSEPTLTVKRNSRGNGAKWVQWMLNQHGYGLTVDGIFGAKSVSALIQFQREHDLVADGLCGKLTRQVLKNY